jgi:hypothetical protein
MPNLPAPEIPLSALSALRSFPFLTITAKNPKHSFILCSQSVY